MEADSFKSDYGQAKAHRFVSIYVRAEARTLQSENARQGLKPNSLSFRYGPTKEAAEK